MSNHTSSTERFSITLYGTKTFGFTYLLSSEAGLVATEGAGSAHSQNKEMTLPVTLPSAALAIKAALAFVPEGSLVAVHAPGTGRMIKCGTAKNGRIDLLCDGHYRKHVV